MFCSFGFVEPKQLIETVNRRTARAITVLTVESGAPNCRACNLAKRSYANFFNETPALRLRLSSRLRIPDAGEIRIESNQIVWDWTGLGRSQSSLASITRGALATASSSTLTLNVGCEGRGKRFQAGSWELGSPRSPCVAVDAGVGRAIYQRLPPATN